jgi:hypothetical protein
MGWVCPSVVWVAVAGVGIGGSASTVDAGKKAVMVAVKAIAAAAAIGPRMSPSWES